MPSTDPEKRRIIQARYSKKKRANYTKEDHARNNKYQIEWRKKNKDKIKRYSKDAYARNKVWFAEYKDKLNCCICETSFKGRTECIDFHHVYGDGKEKGVGAMIPSRTRKTVLKEIAKCVPICSCCHRTLHYGSDKLKAEYQSKVKQTYEGGNLWREQL